MFLLASCQGRYAEEWLARRGCAETEGAAQSYRKSFTCYLCEQIINVKQAGREFSSLFQSIKIYRRLFLYCFVATGQALLKIWLY